METVLQIRVIPNARKNEVVGPYGTGIKIKLQAPPLDGKANEALIAFLAEVLGCAPGNVRLKAGERSRSKVVEIEGLAEEAVRGLLFSDTK